MADILERIARERMPSVADLLKKAASADAVASSKSSKPSKSSASDGATSGGKSSEESKEPTRATLADSETSFDKPDSKPKSGGPKPSPSDTGASRQGLVGTTVGGGNSDTEDSGNEEESLAQLPMGSAVDEQEKLLAEFDQVTGKISDVLQKLEGSTFVKRFKAASRRQTKVAGNLGNLLDRSFGDPAEEVATPVRSGLDDNVRIERRASTRLSNIQSDLEAFASRTDQASAKTVLGEMRDFSVSGDLSDLARSVDRNFGGDSLARSEFWADTFDRWADQLVGPG